MVDKKWQQVREIFGSALRRRPEERSEFVVAACGNDESLLKEVESLLSSLDSADSRFLETPLVANISDVIEPTLQLENGMHLGHYQIIRPLGKGGMGVVYLGRDDRLDRLVAIKLLNDRFGRQPDNIRRFVQEAKAASALNHPN